MSQLNLRWVSALIILKKDKTETEQKYLFCEAKCYSLLQHFRDSRCLVTLDDHQMCKLVVCVHDVREYSPFGRSHSWMSYQHMFRIVHNAKRHIKFIMGDLCLCNRRTVIRDEATWNLPKLSSNNFLPFNEISIFHRLNVFLIIFGTVCSQPNECAFVRVEKWDKKKSKN